MKNTDIMLKMNIVGQIYNYSNGYDLILSIDADEVYGDDLKMHYIMRT